MNSRARNLDAAARAAHLLGGDEASRAVYARYQQVLALIDRHAALLVDFVPEWWVRIVSHYGGWYATHRVVEWVGEDPEHRELLWKEAEQESQSLPLMERNEFFLKRLGLWDEEWDR